MYQRYPILILILQSSSVINKKLVHKSFHSFFKGSAASLKLKINQICSIFFIFTIRSNTTTDHSGNTLYTTKISLLKKLKTIFLSIYTYTEWNCFATTIWFSSENLSDTLWYLLITNQIKKTLKKRCRVIASKSDSESLSEAILMRIGKCK